MPSDDPAPQTTPRRRVDRGLLIASIIIATGAVLIGYAALSAITGDDRTNLPDAIERISPLPDAINVPNQSNIVVDLADGYTGRLIVDGQIFEAVGSGAIDLGAPAPTTTLEPGVQVVREPGLEFTPGVNTLQLTLGEEIGIARWPVGEHQVAVQYWRIGDDPDVSSETYRWQFTIV